MKTNNPIVCDSSKPTTEYPGTGGTPFTVMLYKEFLAALYTGWENNPIKERIYYTTNEAFIKAVATYKYLNRCSSGTNGTRPKQKKGYRDNTLDYIKLKQS